MSTQTTPIIPGPGDTNAIEAQYAAYLGANYARLNAATYGVYQQAFAQAVANGLTPPAPPQLTNFNVALATQILIAYSNELTSGAGGSAANPVANLAPAITTFTPAPIIPAPPVIPTPQADPVGAAQGTTDAQGRQMYYDTAGDTYPNGQTFTDARGTFTRIVQATPFGMESYWSLTH